jgi:hypothetical protein
MLYPSAIREIYFPSFILLTMRIDPIFVDEVCTSQRKNIESNNRLLTLFHGSICIYGARVREEAEVQESDNIIPKFAR